MFDRGTIIIAILALLAVCWIQHEAISARDAEIVELRADLAAAEATAENLRSRAATDAEVITLPEPALREELSKWVR